ncbi:MAG TPA: sulfotransferase [Solirubrobacterales bacterium]|nr:sulfotransferase [Solirubrobacterales bacterium]
MAAGIDERLTWIFGSSRSGSTWLLKMLSAVSGAVPVDDPHLGHHLGVWRPIPLAWATVNGDPPALTTLLELKAAEPGYFFSERHRESWWQPLRDLITTRFEAQASEHDLDPAEASYLVKEPGSHVAPMLTDLFPDSRVIFLLRDGRDVVDSWLAGYRDGGWAVPEGAFAVSDGGRIALLKWLSAVWVYRSHAVRRAFESHPARNRVLVRYEDLRADTVTVLTTICHSLGIDASLVEEVSHGFSFEGLPASQRGPRLRQRAARPGSWMQNMSNAEQAAMHEALGDTLAEFGYRPWVPSGPALDFTSVSDSSPASANSAGGGAHCSVVRCQESDSANAAQNSDSPQAEQGQG